MKKEAIIVLCILTVSLFHSVLAIVGVSPGSYEIDFEPNLKQNFTFVFIFDESVRSELYVGGDLAEYVKLDKGSLVGGGAVTASLDLPTDIEIPGLHVINVGAKQVASGKEGVVIVGNVMGLIKVKVPYPGKYAEIEFTTTNANVGEPVDFTVLVTNLGKENINTAALIQVYDKQEKYIETLDLGNKFIETKKTEVFSTQLNTINYKAGDYNAEAIARYNGKTAEAKRVFRLGTLYVGIANYTEEFEEDKINKFEIEAESFWNDLIENLYANVTIINYNIGFLTPSIDMQPWSKQKLIGFFDTTSIKENKFQANITLHYEGKTTNKIVDLKFKKETNYIMYFTIAAIVLIVIILLTIVLFKKRKNEKKKK